MFTRNIIALFVALLCTSWGRAWVLQVYPDNHKPLYPETLDSTNDYTELEDNMGQFPPSYENLVYRIYDYMLSPSEKYIKVVSRTNFVVENPPGFESSDMHMFWKSVPVKDVLKKPIVREWFVMKITQIAVNLLMESCNELEKTVSPLIINYEPTAMKNATGLNTEKNQFSMKQILLDVQTTKLMLQDLQIRMDFAKNNREVAKRLGKKIKDMEGLLRYTVHAITSVRDSWIHWKIISHYPNEATP